jgi:hypothetical protein
MSALKVLQFPSLPGCQDVSKALRELADEIDKGTKGDAHNIVWALDCGNGRIEVGLMGKAPEPAMTAYYLLGMAQRKLEAI